MNDLAVIILAAGKSSRLGHPKQLVEIKGESLLIRQSIMALSITKHVYCVLGFQSDLLQQQLISLPVNIVINPLWKQGMSSSIASAIEYLPDFIEGVMIVLVDQWQLNEPLLLPLINVFYENKLKIVTSSSANFSNGDLSENCYQNESLAPSKIKIGPPTIFPQRYFYDLTQLVGEKGAKAFIVREKESVIQFDLPEAFIDLDNAEDLSKLRSMYAS